jgi:hypothetical protein
MMPYAQTLRIIQSYSPKCVEGKFPEVRVDAGSKKFGSEVPENVAWIDEKACKGETMLW